MSQKPVFITGAIINPLIILQMPGKYHKLAEFLYNRYGIEKGNEILVKGNIENLAKLYV